MKEKKNNPKLAVNIIMQEPRDRERNYSPGVLHTDFHRVSIDWQIM